MPLALEQNPDSEWFRALVLGVREYAIFLLTPDGHIASWNEGAQRIKGYASDEIIGQHFSVFYPEEDRARQWPQEELRRALAAGRFEDEGWRVRKDRTRFWANVVITPIEENGQLRGFSKVTRDLTERREQEQRLAHSEENLRLLVEGVHDHAMFLLSPDGVVASWNHGAARLLGYAEAEIVGRSVECLYPRADAAAGRPRAHLVSAAHGGHFSEEGWRVRSDGTTLYVHADWTALRHADGTVRAHVHILRDLSEQRRMQELEDEGERIQRFITMLSHELRNPLAPMANAVQVLRALPPQAQLRWSTDLIARQVSHLSRLVDDLLDLGRVTTGKIQLQRSLLELNTLVTAAADAIRATFTEKHVHLQLQIDPQPLFVHGDSTRLTQAVSNLLVNAWKFTPTQGSVLLRLHQVDDLACLQVTDSGKGIAQALLPHVFDPFVQGDMGPARTSGGLGIGLALVKTVVDLHGGSVAAASAGEGHGAKFTVTLPLADPAAPPSPPHVQQDPKPRANPAVKRLLVVDDNRDAADSLAELLRLDGHEVDVAYDAEQALASVARWPPDVALLDLGLPGMDGFELARRLRQDPALANIKLVAISGYGNPRDRAASAQSGFDVHLIKPVDLLELQRHLA